MTIFYQIIFLKGENIRYKVFLAKAMAVIYIVNY